MIAEEAEAGDLEALAAELQAFVGGRLSHHKAPRRRGQGRGARASIS